MIGWNAAECYGESGMGSSDGIRSAVDTARSYGAMGNADGCYLSA